MANTDVLYETFDLYLKKAKQCQAAEDYASAKRYYINAAEQMVKLAKLSNNDVQTVRYQRAKNLLETAKSMDALIKQPASTNAAPAASSDIVVSKPEKVSLDEALKKLNSLEGLDNVKAHVLSWVDQIKVFEMRRQRGLPVPPMSYHMVFTGNPGTGKTTVARIMAEIYCALGIISEGHLVEVDRSHLVAGYVGQTAIKTQEIVKKSIGGVLFIDEAYSLANSSDNDFGRECIDTLLKAMEDNRTDFVVIVAGYAEPMEPFIASNPGLRSRFKTFINFDDYNGKELFSIFKSLCKQNQYRLSEKASDAVEAYLEKLYENRDEEFANARDVRNLFENIVTRQSRRIASMSSPDDEAMITITEDDLSFVKKPPVNKGTIAEKIVPNTPAPEVVEEKTTPEDKVLEEGAAFDSEFKFEWDSLPSVTFDDVAGLDDVKDAVQMKVILPLKNPEIFEGYVKKNGGGLLLYGPPGTGKTMIAAAIANEIKAKFCSVKPSDLLHQGAGQSEKAIRALFAQARQYPCAVIYFDEMDSISPKNTRSQYAKQLRSEFLAQLQGVESYGKDNGNILFLIAATNKPWDIDSAFVRPGRFGTRIYVGLPDMAARSYIIESRLAKIIAKGIVEVADDIPYDTIVEKTEGYNCSDITNLMDKVEELSIRRSFKSGEKSITKEDFDNALNEVTSSVQRADIEKLMEWTNENN